MTTWQRVIFHPLTLIVLTFLSVLFSISLYRSAHRTQQASQNLQVVKAEIETLDQEVAALEQALDEAQQPLTTEKMIRDELLMQKPGEYVVQISETAGEEVSNQPTQLPDSPWSAWKEVLF